MNTIVQYVLVRSDLIKDLKWPIGSVIAQACHASTAVIQQYYDDEHTKEYLKDLDNMHKIVLEVEDNTEILVLQKNLLQNKIDHKLWVEKPEDIPTALALKPYPRNMVKEYVKKYKLFK